MVWKGENTQKAAVLCGKMPLLMPKARGERLDCFEMFCRRASLNVQHVEPWRSRRPHRVSLLSAKISIVCIVVKVHQCAKHFWLCVQKPEVLSTTCELMFCSTNNDGCSLLLLIVPFTAARKVYCSKFLENKVNWACFNGPKLLPRLQMTALPCWWQTQSSKQLKNSGGWFLLALWEQAVHFNEHRKQNPDWWLCFKLQLP